MGLHHRIALVMCLVVDTTCGTVSSTDCGWWYETTEHHGFNFRNVTDFGAVGDGVADDTAALQAAIDFARGGEPGSDADKSAAVIYLGSGTFRVTDTLVLWKWTKLIGNPHCPPTIVLPTSTPAFNGSKGLRPLLVTNTGYNSSAAAHAWWEEAGGGAANENFFTSIHHLRVVVGSDNPGAVAITWNVAQQTSLRNIKVEAANDTAIGIDIGAGKDYEHWNSGVPFTLGGGGVVEDVEIIGAQTGMRVAAAQFAIRNLVIDRAAVQGLRVWQLAWSLAFLNVSVTDTPLAVRIDGRLALPKVNLPGTVTLLDCSVARIGNGTAISTNGKTGLLLQNLVSDGSVTWMVDSSLKRPAAGVVPLWAQGEAYLQGKRIHPLTQGGSLPLPSITAATQQGVPLACSANGTALHLCGGSADNPATGAPYQPLPLFEDERGVLNVLSVGAFGDGKHDDTKALQAAISQSRTVFIPFGIYLISDSLLLRPDSRIVGEGQSVIRAMPNSFPVTGGNKPFINAPPPRPDHPDDQVSLASLSLWNMDCGNEALVMLEWEAGEGSAIHDVNMLLACTVAAKALVIGKGAGYVSNAWWPATMSYQPSSADRQRHAVDLHFQAEAFMHRMPQSSPVQDSNTSVEDASPLSCETPTLSNIGVLVTSAGPMWWCGINLEHSIDLELAFLPGAVNHMVIGFQSEEAEIALALNATKNTVVWGSLNGFWNTSVSSPAPVVAVRLDPAGADLAYRLYGLNVPVAKSEKALFVDEGRYELPATNGFSSATAVLNQRPPQLPPV
jgi:glucan 1,3-beta-glucosidase